jgi:hypothetical protein
MEGNERYSDLVTAKRLIGSEGSAGSTWPDPVCWSTVYEGLVMQAAANTAGGR